MQTHFKRWINLLFAGRTKKTVEKMADEIVRQCHPILMQRIFGKTKAMPPEQMRGYVRAYSAYCTETIINRRNDIEHLTPSQFAKIISLAKEILIEIVLRDTRSIPPKVVEDIATAA